MSEPKRYARAEALGVAKELCDGLIPLCEAGRIIVAGSLRRRKATVKDIEIVYVSKSVTVMDGLFDTKVMPAVDNLLVELLGQGVLAMRRNVNGSTMWGAKNKFALHVGSGIGVDLFATTEACFFNYLVCRTGGKESNTAITMAAQDKGWKWNPYGEGFSRASGLGTETHVVRSEREVFEFVKLPYREPWERL